MAEMQPHATEEDTHMANIPPYPAISTPRWVKLLGIIVIVLVLVGIIIMVSGVGGSHGPSRHIPSADAGGYALPIEQGIYQL